MDPTRFTVEAREDGYYIGDRKVSDEMAREILGIVEDSLPTYDDIAREAHEKQERVDLFMRKNDYVRLKCKSSICSREEKTSKPVKSFINICFHHSDIYEIPYIYDPRTKSDDNKPSNGVYWYGQDGPRSKIWLQYIYLQERLNDKIDTTLIPLLSDDNYYLIPIKLFDKSSILYVIKNSFSCNHVCRFNDISGCIYEFRPVLEELVEELYPFLTKYTRWKEMFKSYIKDSRQYDNIKILDPYIKSDKLIMFFINNVKKMEEDEIKEQYGYVD